MSEMLISHKCPVAILSSLSREFCLGRKNSVWSRGQDSWLSIHGHGKKTEQNILEARGRRRVYQTWPKGSERKIGANLQS